jgi:upstream activation factor subunit UAF30
VRCSFTKTSAFSDEKVPIQIEKKLISPMKNLFFSSSMRLPVKTCFSLEINQLLEGHSKMATAKKTAEPAKKVAPAKKIVAKKAAAAPAAAKKAAPAKKATAAKTPAQTPAKTPAVKRTANAAFMKPLTPSAALAAVVGAAPLPRTEVVSKLWVYIKKNKLQDAANKRMINSDSKLKEVFGKAQVSMFEMSGLISSHLK